MATFHGKNANIFWDENALNISEGQSWTLEATAEVAEDTCFQDSWKSYVGGFKDWTATVECNMPVAGSEIPFATAGGVSGLGEDSVTLVADNQNNLQLYLDWDLVSGSSTVNNVACLYGNAILTGISHTVDLNDVGKLTYNFQGVAAIAFFESSTTSHPITADG